VHFFIIVITVDVSRRTYSNVMLQASNQPNTCIFTSKQILLLCVLDARTSLADFFLDSMKEEH